MTHGTKGGVERRWLGIDYGQKRIGLSYAETLGVALPLAAVKGASQSSCLDQIESMIRKCGITELVIGYPFHMNGKVGDKVREVEAFIVELRRRFGLPIHRVDERLSTYQARRDTQCFLQKREKCLKQRIAQRRTGTLDSRAATLILQDYLDQKGADVHLGTLTLLEPA